MTDYNSFMNMNINMNEFENVYNSMANKPMIFGGGEMKINDLLNKYLSKKIKGGYTDADNFFHLTRPSLSPTNTNYMSDYNYRNFDYPSVLNNNRT